MGSCFDQILLLALMSADVTELLRIIADFAQLDFLCRGDLPSAIEWVRVNGTLLTKGMLW